MTHSEITKRATTYFMLTSRYTIYDDSFMHIPCQSCGMPIGRSGVYLLKYGKYFCYQPNCYFRKTSKTHNIQRYLKEQLGDNYQEVLAEYEQNQDYTDDSSKYLPSFSSAISYSSPLSYSTLGSFNLKEYEIELPEVAIPITSGSTPMSHLARDYIKSRGISVEDAWDKYKIHHVVSFTPEYSTFFGYLIIPVFDRNGVLVYFQARDFEGNKQRYVNPKKHTLKVSKKTVLFNEQELWLYDEISISEGVFDAIELSKPLEGYENTLGISGLGKEIHDRQIYKILKSPCKRINIVSDDGSYFDWLEVGYRMLDGGKEVKVLCFEGIKEDGKWKKDAADFGKKRIYEALERVPILTPNYYMSEHINRIIKNGYHYSGTQNLLI